MNGCTWTATSNASWITVTGGASGNGNGTVSYMVAANTATTARMATVTIAGQTVSVTQSGACAFTLSSTAQNVGANGGAGSTTVAAMNGCTWTATSNASWIAVTAGRTGNGNGTVAYSVAAYTGSLARTGTLTVAGQTVTVTQGAGPALTLSTSTATTGSRVAVTLTNGLGGPSDWLALAPTSAPDNSNVTWAYIGAGVKTTTWTVTMPNNVGTYEVRLFLNNSYTRAATSAPITVTQGANPTPVLSALAPNAIAAGVSSFTFRATGTGFLPSSVVRWNGQDRPTTFLAANTLQVSVFGADLAVPGSAQVTVFTPAPGGGSSVALPFAITSSPVLTVSATTALPGSTVTVTLTGGLGGATDWLALSPASAPDTNYLSYVYVGAGVLAKTWTFAMPTTPGDYQFRLFANNSYSRASTSPIVTVSLGPAVLSSGHLELNRNLARQPFRRHNTRR
jgi:hypothetical protein